MLVTNVFYANSDFELIYVNTNGLKTLEEINNTIEEIYDFSWDELIGKSIDEFHPNPKYQRKILCNPKNFPLNAEIKLGEMVLDLNVNIVQDNSGNIDSYIVNWEEISEKKTPLETATRVQQMVDLSPINTMMADPT